MSILNHLLRKFIRVIMNANFSVRRQPVADQCLPATSGPNIGEIFRRIQFWHATLTSMP